MDISGWVSSNLMLLGVAAFISGVALFYLVMQRTRKHREMTATDDS